MILFESICYYSGNPKKKVRHEKVWLSIGKLHSLQLSRAMSGRSTAESSPKKRSKVSHPNETVSNVVTDIGKQTLPGDIDPLQFFQSFVDKRWPAKFHSVISDEKWKG